MSLLLGKCSKEGRPCADSSDRGHTPDREAHGLRSQITESLEEIREAAWRRRHLNLKGT